MIKFKKFLLKTISLLLFLPWLLGCSPTGPTAGATLPTSIPATTTASVPASPSPAQEETNQVIRTDKFQGVIFTKEKAEADQPVYRAEGYWTPGQADILALEEQLGPYLQQAAPQSYPGPLRDLSTYKRQYVGLLAKGQRLIWVNFFCQAHEIDWQEEFVFIADGGSCYFELKYNPETGNFSDLSIHGEA